VARLVLPLLATPALAADFTVDLTAPLKPVDHAASGALYGIAAPGWPPQAFIDRIHPKNFTQMAPGGHQLPNGETTPTGDALVVAPLAAAAGASITVRLPDTFPSFPYLWQGNAFWTAEVDRIARAVRAADPPNIYAYEIWNEPDWNWQSQWGDFDAVWARTYGALRTMDPSRRIMGPCASRFDAAWMRRFLRAAITAHAVPDIVSWHELDPRDADDIEAHVTAYRDLEHELGLAPHPISINEYGSQRAMADPGALVHYIAQLERAGVDTADLAFWHRPGRLGDLLVPKTAGTGPATDPLPTGGDGLYAWYGAMTGSMVAAKPAAGSSLDGLAAYDEAARRADIVLGGGAGDLTVAVSVPAGFGPLVRATAEATRWTGTDGPLLAPEPLFVGQFAAEDGTVTIPLHLDGDSEAVRLRLTAAPAGASGTFLHEAPRPLVQRIEAESGTMTLGRRFTIRMAPSNFAAHRASGNAYVGFFNRAGARLTLPITAPAAGRYELTFGYSNGQATPVAADLAIDNRPAGRLSFPPTQGRELFGLLRTTAMLPKGQSTLTLTLAAPVSRLPAGPSVLELDRVEVTAE
jgi:hypothetical protein